MCGIMDRTEQIDFHILTQDTALLLMTARGREEVFDNEVDADQLAGFVQDAGHEMVFAVADGRLLGMASGTVLRHPDKQPALFVNEVGVAIDMRNQGLGAELTQRLIDLARARDCKGIWLATEEDNAPARALYRKLGARETGGIVVYDWDGAMDE